MEQIREVGLMIWPEVEGQKVAAHTSPAVLALVASGRAPLDSPPELVEAARRARRAARTAA